MGKIVILVNVRSVSCTQYILQAYACNDRGKLVLIGAHKSPGCFYPVCQPNMDSFQAKDKTWLGVEALLSDLQNLIDDRDSADVLFLVGHDETAIYAHRLILVTRCKHFQNRKRELWSSKAVHSQLTVRKPEFRPDVFREVLKFLYTGKVTRKMRLKIDFDCCTYFVYI